MSNLFYEVGSSFTSSLISSLGIYGGFALSLLGGLAAFGCISYVVYSAFNVPIPPKLEEKLEDLTREQTQIREQQTQIREEAQYISTIVEETDHKVDLLSGNIHALNTQVNDLSNQTNSIETKLNDISIHSQQISLEVVRSTSKLDQLSSKVNVIENENKTIAIHQDHHSVKMDNNFSKFSLKFDKFAFDVKQIKDSIGDLKRILLESIVNNAPIPEGETSILTESIPDSTSAIPGNRIINSELKAEVEALNEFPSVPTHNPNFRRSRSYGDLPIQKLSLPKS